MKDGQKKITTFAMVVRKGSIVAKVLHKHHRFDAAYQAKQLFVNEAQALKLVRGKPGFQQLKKTDWPILYTAYAGSRLKQKDVDRDVAAAQALKILERLRQAGVVHRDIRPDNLLWDGRRIVLIDFQWAFFAGSFFKSVDDAPGVLGGKYKSPHGFKDRYSMWATLRDIFG